MLLIYIYQHILICYVSIILYIYIYIYNTELLSVFCFLMDRQTRRMLGWPLKMTSSTSETVGHRRWAVLLAAVLYPWKAGARSHVKQVCTGNTGRVLYSVLISSRGSIAWRPSTEKRAAVSCNSNLPDVIGFEMHLLSFRISLELQWWLPAIVVTIFTFP